MLGRVAAVVVTADLLLATTGGAILAHHGFTSFRTEAPIYLEGRIVEVHWGNPHPVVTLEVAQQPTGTPWRQWTLPAGWADMGTGHIVGSTTIPTNATGRWAVEFSGFSQQPRFGFAESPRVGEPIAIVAFQACQGNPRLARSTLVHYRGQTFSQQSGRVPRGCSGQRPTQS